ncbi:MAG: hypothetical protein J07HX5_00902 [halophilic archaeon J07HX5]|jgi:hypothetical protein|nr:MAG: hypothetical protein J07HX5_00902 [halophilic archaeon J07HX5]
MGLSEIAAGIEVTSAQERREVTIIDETDATVTERLAPFAGVLPCEPDAAATAVKRYTAGANVDTAAQAAGLSPITTTKTLHLLGEPVSPVGSADQAVIRDWTNGDCSRHEALKRTQAAETDCMLAAYVETHRPLAEAQRAIEGLLATRRVRRNE